jgi:hypothetical protein
MTARVVTLLERHGKDLAALGVARAELRNPDARIDVASVDAPVEVAAEALGAAGLGRDAQRSPRESRATHG